MWILLCEYNDYDQHGEYFLAAWPEKPTKDALAFMLTYDLKNMAGLLEHVWAGGGRKDSEYKWFRFFEYKRPHK